jgi:periplasmic divalent cation tolerance protein
MQEETRFVYITCADRAEARRIGRALVEERLAACVNLRPHEAIYRWQGAVEEAEEYGLLAKTTASGLAPLEARVRMLHSYTLPCIVAWTPSEGLAAYLDWIGENVGPERTGPEKA